MNLKHYISAIIKFNKQIQKKSKLIYNFSDLACELRKMAYKIPKDKRIVVGFSKKHNWEIYINIPNTIYKVMYVRMIRGDYIEIKNKITDKEVIAYVDQTRAYDGLLGLNDIKCELSRKRIHVITKKLLKENNE